jgi:hypothetical protein
LGTALRVRKDLLVEHVGDQSLLLVDMDHMVTLNRAGGDLAEIMMAHFQGRDFDLDDLAGLISAEYGLDRNVAREEARLIVKDWTEVGILEGETAQADQA